VLAPDLSGHGTMATLILKAYGPGSSVTPVSHLQCTREGHTLRRGRILLFMTTQRRVLETMSSFSSQSVCQSSQ
jgi:hypothetical protein